LHAKLSRWQVPSSFRTTLVITSAIGLYYYLRVVIALYGSVDKHVAAGRLALTPKLLLGALTVLLVWFGIFPNGLLRVIHDAVAGLT
jgi:NADH-quinone oxidoreductase subunit N